MDYIQPITDVAEDDDLSAIFQAAIVGITGLHPDLVRPLWQPQPPTQPEAEIDWCGIGVTVLTGVDYPEYHQIDETTGMQSRYERIDVRAMFYGPNSTRYAARFRDGLYIWDNYTVLALQGIKLRSADDITHVPELMNAQYIGRSDVPCSFMRMINRIYDVPTIGQASVSFITDDGLGCTTTISQ
jgi:hypothetical protein